MRGQAKLNAIRSGIVVIGSLAFGYLTLQIGFQPFLQKAHEQEQTLQVQSSSSLPSEQEEDTSSHCL